MGVRAMEDPTTKLLWGSGPPDLHGIGAYERRICIWPRFGWRWISLSDIYRSRLVEFESYYQVSCQIVCISKFLPLQDFTATDNINSNPAYHRTDPIGPNQKRQIKLHLELVITCAYKR